MLKPCQNNGVCTDTNTTTLGYKCTCPRGFDGTQCQLDNRPCKTNNLLERWSLSFFFSSIIEKSDFYFFLGVCYEPSNTTFKCSCLNGWTGTHCERKVNYCENVKCLNNAVCRPLFLNYTCECLGTSYSGRHCEIVATALVVRQVVCKSFGYIAILFLVIVVSFFVIMDILKYCFGIDPAKHELEKFRRAKAARRAKRPPVIQRFIYVNAPSSRRSARKNDLDIEEANV